METGLYVPGKAHSRGQCLHCFRHHFAIHSFAQAEKNGRSTDDSVPFLSVYLGHHDMDETEKYLKFNGRLIPWVHGGCSASTRNLRLSALASFSFYAQNRNFEAATVFANAVRRTPVKKEAIQPRITFSLDEVSVLLHLPNPQKRLGFRDQVLLNLCTPWSKGTGNLWSLRLETFL